MNKLMGMNGITEDTLDGLKRINNKYTTVKYVSEFYNVSKNRVDKIIKRYKEEIEEYGLKLCSRLEVRKLFEGECNYIKNTGRSSDTLIINNEEITITNGGLFLLTDDTVIKIGFLIDDDTIVKRHSGLYSGRLSRIRSESEFLNVLEDTLSIMGIELERQYSIMNYRIDAYIPKLNIAIEYDESNHKHYTYKQHYGRQHEIENKLGCKFIRINECDSIGVGIGKVMNGLNTVA